MEKAYSRIKWENYPSVVTPLNEANLNKMDVALNEVDNRVLGLDTAKLDKSAANTMVKDISFVENTGIFTITLLNGTKKTIDTKLEKIATNFSYDYQTQKLNLTLVDGTKQELDLTSLISQFEFIDSDTIDITVDSSGKVSAIVKDGSITENKLQPNFLADVKVEVAKAKSSSDSAYENATIARESAVDAKTYRDEAEQFRNQAEAASGVTIATTEKAGLVKPDGDTIRVDPDGTIHADRGTTSYTDLENKPKINNVVLEGEKTLDELGIASKEALEETDSKVNIIIEQAELRFKETASGENIRLDDSADSKLVEFALYGKATQDGEPTPENPVDIVVAGSSGSVEVKSRGKNLLDNSLVKAGQITSNDGFTIIETTSTYYYPEFINVNSNEKYIFINPKNLPIRVFEYNNNKQYISEKVVNLDYFQVSASCSFIRFHSSARSFVDGLELNAIKLSTISTPNGIAGIPVSSGGNYTDQNGQQWICDEVVKYADGSGEHIQRVGKVAFNGSETWGKSSNTNNNTYYTSVLDALKVSDTNPNYGMLCNRFVERPYSNHGEVACCSYGNPNNSKAELRISVGLSSSLTTVDLFKNWLSSKPTNVYYKLAEPIHTPLTAEELAEIENLSTFYPATSISNDADCGMKVKYIADAKSYIDNRLDLIEQAMLNSI